MTKLHFTTEQKRRLDDLLNEVVPPHAYDSDTVLDMDVHVYPQSAKRSSLFNREFVGRMLVSFATGFGLGQFAFTVCRLLGWVYPL